MIIVFEGGEGAGKSTQTALLQAFLQKKGRQAITFREPGGSDLSEKIRSLFLTYSMDVITELLLVLASRRENIVSLMQPALEQGKDIIIDRWIDSTLVYQGLMGGIQYETVTSLMHATQTWLEPDFCFLLDLDPEKARERYSAADRFERQDITWHNRLRHGFLDLAQDTRHKIIDASPPASEVHQKIITILESAIST